MGFLFANCPSFNPGYSGPWSIIKVIYVLIRALAAVDFM